MNTTNNTYTSDVFTGETDAHISIKAAASGSGLYIYALVEDNIWVNPARTGLSDAVDFCIDASTSEQVLNAAVANFVAPACGWAVTKTTTQYMVYMGSSTQPTTRRPI